MAQLTPIPDRDVPALDFDWTTQMYRTYANTRINNILLEVDGGAMGHGYNWAIARYPGGLIIGSNTIEPGIEYADPYSAALAAERYFKKHIMLAEVTSSNSR